MILSERFIRLSIAELERQIKDLEGFNKSGYELERREEYERWLRELRQYYSENIEVYREEKVKDENIFKKRITKMMKK